MQYILDSDQSETAEDLTSEPEEWERAAENNLEIIMILMYVNGKNGFLSLTEFQTVYFIIFTGNFVQHIFAAHKTHGFPADFLHFGFFIHGLSPFPIIGYQIFVLNLYASGSKGV